MNYGLYGFAKPWMYAKAATAPFVYGKAAKAPYVYGKAAKARAAKLTVNPWMYGKYPWVI